MATKVGLIMTSLKIWSGLAKEVLFQKIVTK